MQVYASPAVRYLNRNEHVYRTWNKILNIIFGKFYVLYMITEV